ncbi:MAG: aspartate carbamoyltransferase regulatory subunit [Clostridia bacterium]|nr:aspartate carbamoyltransferase regulatory subunit [Clostridia bacterium]
MNIDSIQNGYVIDHIQAGLSMEIYRYLKLNQQGCSVAIIQNAKSRRMGKKDIIKIDAEISINLDMLGYTDPGITVNVTREGVRAEKKCLALPERVSNVIRCRNPRCVSQEEREIEQIFFLADRENHVYRCLYCESAHRHEEP